MPATNAQRLLLLEEIQGDVPNIGSRKISESLYEADIGLLRPHSGAPKIRSDASRDSVASPPLQGTWLMLGKL